MTHETYGAEFTRKEKTAGSTADFMASTSMIARFKELSAESQSRLNPNSTSAQTLAIGSRATAEVIERIHNEYDPTTKD